MESLLENLGFHGPNRESWVIEFPSLEVPGYCLFKGQAGPLNSPRWRGGRRSLTGWCQEKHSMGKEWWHFTNHPALTGTPPMEGNLDLCWI